MKDSKDFLDQKGMWGESCTFPSLQTKNGFLSSKEDCLLAFILKSLGMGTLKEILCSLKNSHS